MNYIHYHKRWPSFQFDASQLLVNVSKVRSLQGKLAGKMQALGFQLSGEAHFEALSQDVIKSSEIEGELLELAQVRSSLARRLGMDVSGLVPSDRNVDGVVEMMLDATQNAEANLTEDRLFGWHSAMFPSGRSGMFKIVVGAWRDDSTGPMQVVSGALGREIVHFLAPDATKIEAEMKLFLEWFNANNDLEPTIKAGIAHLWFLTIHPFEDGNGRIARAITDMLLSRLDVSPQRYYSMSAQISVERNDYYEILEKTQKGDLDITGWLVWFLSCLERALIASDKIVNKVLVKHKFWMKHKDTPFNKRQSAMLKKLNEDFFGKLTTSKWAKMMKCSNDTALRDIQDLLKKEVLEKDPAGGRSAGYRLNN